MKLKNYTEEDETEENQRNIDGSNIERDTESGQTEQVSLEESLTAVRAELKSLGFKPRSSEEAAAIQKKREDELRMEIEGIERNLGTKLSPESFAMIRKKQADAVKADEKAYAERFSELLSKEKELTRGIESQKPDLQRAQEYWARALDGETRIETPMNPNCEISVVIPAYNEDVDRIVRQIESFKQQNNVLPDSFELIYVVNNDVAKDSDKSRDVIATNARLMDFLRKDHGIPIRVIDKSSAGNEIDGCNVGKARNRGVAESALRFQEIDRNGIIIQTDADTWLEDEDYLAKVRSKMKSQDNLIGLAGGLHLEWDPETKDPKERAELRRKVDRFFLRKIAERFAEFLHEPNKHGHFSTSFMGANMISRSFESAVIGGIPPIKGGEDGEFGHELEDYSQRKGKSVEGAKHELFVTTSFRESDRTGSSFKKIFDSIDPDKPEFVPNAFAQTNPEEPKEVELNQVYIDRLKDAIREKESGAEFVDDFEKSLGYIRLK